MRLSLKSDMKKVILITGASSGIGHASAKALLQKGFTVYATARRTELMKDLEQSGAKIKKCDVTKDEDIQNVVDEIITNEGRIDILYANAGFCLIGPIEFHDIEDVKYQFDVNVFGVGRAITAVLPHMRQQQSGRILITSSGAAHVSYPGMIWYPATKHAIKGLADGLRMEVKEFGIDIIQIEPGITRTGIKKASMPYLDKAEKHANASAYARQTKVFRNNWWGKMWKAAAPVSTVTKVVVKACTSKRPKRTYTPNIDAKLAVFSRKFLGYGILDKPISKRAIGNNEK